jgi:hypothetical protein
MAELLPFLVFAAVLAAVLGCFSWLALLARRRGVAGAAIRAAMASYDEAFHGTAHQSHYEIQEQSRRRLPIQSPDDPLRAAPGRAHRSGDGAQ